jgi:hypothetical protein
MTHLEDTERSTGPQMAFRVFPKDPFFFPSLWRVGLNPGAPSPSAEAFGSNQASVSLADPWGWRPSGPGQADRRAGKAAWSRVCGARARRGGPGAGAGSPRSRLNGHFRNTNNFRNKVTKPPKGALKGECLVAPYYGVGLAPA